MHTLTYTHRHIAIYIQARAHRQTDMHTQIQTHAHTLYIGILFDNQLKFHSYTTEVAAKANHLLD